MVVVEPLLLRKYVLLDHLVLEEYCNTDGCAKGIVVILQLVLPVQVTCLEVDIFSCNLNTILDTDLITFFESGTNTPFIVPQEKQKSIM